MTAHRHHALDYLELTVADLAAAKRFYAEAFGWAFNDYGPGYAGIKDPDDAAAEVGGLAVGEGGAGAAGSAAAERSAGPLVLLYSEDLDASAAAVTAAGGRIVSGPYEFPGGWRFHFTDPSGNELGIWSPR